MYTYIHTELLHSWQHFGRVNRKELSYSFFLQFAALFILNLNYLSLQLYYFYPYLCCDGKKALTRSFSFLQTNTRRRRCYKRKWTEVEWRTHTNCLKRKSKSYNFYRITKILTKNERNNRQRTKKEIKIKGKTVSELTF